MQGNHKLTGSLNVTLSFCPSRLGRGWKMQLIEHRNLRRKQELVFQGSRFGFLALPVTALSLFLVNKVPSLAGWRVLSA